MLILSSLTPFWLQMLYFMGIIFKSLQSWLLPDSQPHVTPCSFLSYELQTHRLPFSPWKSKFLPPQHLVLTGPSLCWEGFPFFHNCPSCPSGHRWTVAFSLAKAIFTKVGLFFTFHCIWQLISFIVLTVVFVFLLVHYPESSILI